MTDLIRVNYDELNAIVQRFEEQAEQIALILARINRILDQLARGGWQGENASVFYDTMESEILPAYRRLIEALQEAQARTQQIIQVYETAEEEAAGMLGQAVGIPQSSVGIGTSDYYASQFQNIQSVFRNSPQLTNLLQQSQSANIALQVGGQFVGGNPNGTASNLTLDNVDQYSQAETNRILAHEIQHIIDQQDNRLGRVIDPTTTIPSDFLTNNRSRQEVANLIERDIHQRTSLEIRANQALAGSDALGSQLPDSNDVQTFLQEQPAYRDLYMNEYSRFIQSQVGSETDLNFWIEIGEDGRVDIVEYLAN